MNQFGLFPDLWRAEIKKAAKAVWITWKQMRFSSI